MTVEDIESSPSEEETLKSRGYKLTKKLGQGSYAVVYLAQFESTGTEAVKNKQLACKIVDASKAPADFVKKFLPRELEILVKINHPHIIHVHSIFQKKLKYFIFMRYAENGDLLEYIINKGPISEAQARVWIRQLCLAVQYLHDMNIAHRDLKCENALITTNFNLKLADFGFARFLNTVGKKAGTSSTYCGSLSYAAPEILRGTPYQPKYSDVWSLGIILYVMLNKSMPFDDANVRILYDQQMNKRFRVRSKVREMSDEVKVIFDKILEPDIGKRWSILKVLKSDWMKIDARMMQLNSQELAAISRTKPKPDGSTMSQKNAKKTTSSGMQVLKDITKTRLENASSFIKETQESRKKLK